MFIAFDALIILNLPPSAKIVTPSSQRLPNHRPKAARGVVSCTCAFPMLYSYSRLLRAHNKAKRARKNKSKLVVTVSITNVLVENLSPPLPPGPFTFTFPPNKPDLDCDLVHIASSSKITLESLGSIRKRSDLENFFNWSASKDESERESNEAHESDGDEHQFEQRDEYDSEGGYEHDSEEGIEP